jgi:hypothetical protein
MSERIKLEKKFRYCYECDEFPCARVKRLDKRYRTKYEMGMIENLEYIRDILEKIMLDADKYESSNYAKKAAWWRGATLRLEKFKYRRMCKKCQKNKLVDQGNTVLIIEHNIDILSYVDYLIELGPEGGPKGGKIIAMGTPEEVKMNEQSKTAPFLA